MMAPDTTILSANARAAVAVDPHGANFPWAGASEPRCVSSCIAWLRLVGRENEAEGWLIADRRCEEAEEEGCCRQGEQCLWAHGKTMRTTPSHPVPHKTSSSTTLFILVRCAGASRCRGCCSRSWSSGSSRRSCCPAAAGALDSATQTRTKMRAPCLSSHLYPLFQ